MSYSEPDATTRRLVADDDGNTVWDRLINKFTGMGLASLGANDFGITFERILNPAPQKQSKKKYIYVTKGEDKAEFIANLFFEIGSREEGTWVAAYPQKRPHNMPFGDNQNPLRLTLAGRCPLDAPPEGEKIFKNFLCALDGVRDADHEVEKQSGKKFKVTECTRRVDNNKDLPGDLIVLHLQPLYETPFGRQNQSPAPRHARNRKAPTDVEMDEPEATPVWKVGDTYSPGLMPDHKGTYFNHNKAVMPQYDYRDKNGKLIAAHEYWETLTEGTLVLAKVSLSYYEFQEPNPRFLDPKVRAITWPVFPY
ncbi:hypothetical protein FB45DRAFT_1076657 [Roridomyces roridus]|uniref:Uncharacterized protein n=1 Tax=Roridomyces roridus TaxID=1738132 RepID=A0AAD7CJ01_9AGAR|nr:hypothetical protein FB45DRAFT_1076657 [Roridomyces roridus]